MCCYVFLSDESLLTDVIIIRLTGLTCSKGPGFLELVILFEFQPQH